MEDLVRAAIDHHVTTNRHHPKFHTDSDDMTKVDLIEMICDWTAISQEFGQDGGSAHGTIGRRIHLSTENRHFIYEMIDLIDFRLIAYR